LFRSAIARRIFNASSETSKGYVNKQFSGRKFHAAHKDLRFSYFPDASENKAFSDFQITEKRRNFWINSSIKNSLTEIRAWERTPLMNEVSTFG
jgi:hypothetical protein